MAFRAKESQTTMPARSSTPRIPAMESASSRTNGVRPTVPGGTAPLKRKAEGGLGSGPPPKLVKTEGNGVAPRPGGQVRVCSITARPIASATVGAGGYKGTARGLSSSNTARPAQNNTVKTASTTPASASAAAKPAPKGYAAVLAKAAAAAEAHKAAASASIVHKPVEKLTKRERERLKQETLEKQKAEKAAGRNGKMVVQAGRSRSGTPGDASASMAGKKAPPKIAYQGTMRKLPSAPAANGYKGTMRAVDPAKPAKPQKTTDKFGGQDKYGGYASWSDLDEAEDEDQGDYDSESDMEGGFDEMEEEELAATRLARKEDQEAQAEEERLKKEKLARKQKLMALSKDARGKKKF